MDTRWIVKRTLKWAVEFASKFSGAAALYRNSDYYRNSFRILTYHKITDSPQTTHDLTKKHFAEHCRVLANEFRTSSLSELVVKLRHGNKPEPYSVALTFDDGYAELGGFVAETLDKYSLTATFFVVTGFIDNQVRSDKGPYVTWQDLKVLSQAGFSIGSHSVSHLSMKDLDPEKLNYELRHSFNRIQEELGEAPVGFSYPYGTKRDFSDRTMQSTIEAGYPWAVTAIHGVNSLGFDAYSLKRINITCGDGPKTLQLIMNGCLDAWGVIDSLGYRFQRSNYKVTKPTMKP